MLNERIGFIGAGQMASALGQGFVKAGLASSLLAGDPSADARQQFARLTGGRTTASNVEVAAESDVLFLAVKPQHVGKVLGRAADGRRPEKLWSRSRPGSAWQCCRPALAPRSGSFG